MNGGELQGDIRKYFRDRLSAGDEVVYRLATSTGNEIVLKTSVGHMTDDREGMERLPENEYVADAPEGIASMDMDELKEAVAGCERCSLGATRTNTVFGDGNPGARIVFVGEAPGRDEDLQGVPFVGRSGKLLDKILAAIGFTREDVFIANILKCRPPNNRDPQEEEVTACEKYLARQLQLIDPVVICALGRVAGQNLLKTKKSLKVLREQIHSYNGIRLIVTYHPAALLRNPNFKRPAWEDMKLLKKIYEEGTGD
ncbi:MAG: uracil-DNA glycosylase [Bacteroidales bacterium]|nr:uracil-DNA glycosylase [Candidatus Latescibacterota bacterium]